MEQVEGNDQRADWAIMRARRSFLGEVVLNELDADNASMNYRISLRGSEVYGQGYGTEAGRAVINFGLACSGCTGSACRSMRSTSGPSRLSQARFQHEGMLRHALRWEDEWHNALVMSIVAGDSIPD